MSGILGRLAELREPERRLMRPATKCTLAALTAAFALSSCWGPEVDKPGASQTTRVIATPDTQPATAAEAPPFSPSAPPQVVIADAAPGAIYVCVTETAGQTLQTTIEFSPQVAELCRKAPEMGPCQYERDACRQSGGRVFAIDGTEITRQTEVEYDNRVMRIRMKSN
jgi:hypothetical protein